MNKSLLLPLALLCAVPAVGAAPSPVKVKAHQVTGTAPLSPLKTYSVINPVAATASGRLDESFERPDKTFPEGWETQLENDNDWMIYAPGMMGIGVPDGVYAAMGTCLALHDASWLTSPSFTVNEGEQLMFSLYFDVRALYEWTTTGDDKNIDEEDGLILNRVNAENMKICVSVDGGEWIVLKDLWDEYGKLGYYTILDDYPTPEFREFVIPLGEYAGKNVRLGFCHSYTSEKGGHGMFLDVVKVALPPVKASYSLPSGSMFYGMTNDLQAMPSWALMPYYTDLTFVNNTPEDASWNWSYSALAGSGDAVTSADRDLTVRYIPDYTDNPESTYTMFSFPTLEATNDAGTTGTYTYAGDAGFVFAGVSPELPSRDGGAVKFGMSTFDQADDVQIYNADFDVPAWGYNAMTQDWWTNHYFRNDAAEGDYAKVVANMNFFYSCGASIVIDGVRVAGAGMFDDDAEFKMEIITLSEDFEPSDIVATKIIRGSEVVRIDDSMANFPNSVMMCFEFDEPVVLDGVNFIARFSGFDSDKVRYYSPLQSYEDAELCYGWAALEVFSSSMGSVTPEETFVPVVNMGGKQNSFAMYLDAHFHYLKCEEDSFEATEETPSKTFVFDSSYPASELKVADLAGEIPSWIAVGKEGSFGATKVTVTALEGSDGNEPKTSELFVTAPGVSHKITVKQGRYSGISDITAPNGSPVVERQWFDLTGRRLASEPVSGVAVVRDIHADGTVTLRKVMK